MAGRDLRTTHDWSDDVDPAHLARIREDPDRYCGSDAVHLVLEVLAYAMDEAESGTTRSVEIEIHDDGSVSVADDGRGTGTRLDEHGAPVVKPVMATCDLRFFDWPQAPRLVDGRPRSGMSVVTAMSEWLVHENRRADGAWRRRYENGRPTGRQVDLPDDGSTGTVVHFRPGPDVAGLDHERLGALVADLPTDAEIVVR